MIIDYFIAIGIGVLVIEFATKKLLGVYLYVGEQLNEKNKH